MAPETSRTRRPETPSAAAEHEQQEGEERRRCAFLAGGQPGERRHGHQHLSAGTEALPREAVRRVEPAAVARAAGRLAQEGALTGREGGGAGGTRRVDPQQLVCHGEPPRGRRERVERLALGQALGGVSHEGGLDAQIVRLDGSLRARVREERHEHGDRGAHRSGRRDQLPAQRHDDALLVLVLEREPCGPAQLERSRERAERIVGDGQHDRAAARRRAEDRERAEAVELAHPRGEPDHHQEARATPTERMPGEAEKREAERRAMAGAEDLAVERALRLAFERAHHVALGAALEHVAERRHQEQCATGAGEERSQGRRVEPQQRREVHRHQTAREDARQGVRERVARAEGARALGPRRHAASCGVPAER